MKNNRKGRIIFHIDMNAFFCSVAEIKDPSLRGKAFAIGRSGSLKGVISTASYEARKYGIHSAMPLQTAYKLLPSLLVIDGDYKEYEKYHKRFVALIREYTDLIEVASIDEVYADMTHTIEIIHPLVLARLIQYRLLKELGLPSSIGIGPTLFYAKMASDMKKPMGLTVIRKKEKEKILYPLSVKDIFGIGKKTSPRLIEAGINTIGDFMNPDNKEKIIGLVGMNTYNYVISHVNGNSSNEVEPNRYSDSQSISTSTTYDVYLSTYEEVITELRILLNKCYERLTKEKYLAKSLIITLRNDKFNTISRRKTLDEYSDNLNDFKLLLDDLAKIYYNEEETYRLLGVGFSNLVKKDELKKEENLFNFTEFTKDEELDKLVKEFSDKYGEDAIIWHKRKE